MFSVGPNLPLSPVGEIDDILTHFYVTEPSIYPYKFFNLYSSFHSLLIEQDIQQLLQLQQLVLVPGHSLPSPAQFLLPQAQQGQQGGQFFVFLAEISWEC